MTPRQEELLDRLIEAYIKLAQPISSQWLRSHSDLDVSPATIRNDLRSLSEQGFLQKPYISSGRVPTDKGYRFFVDRTLAGKKNTEDVGFVKEIEEFFERVDDLESKFIGYVARRLSNLSSMLTALYFPEEEILLKEGWEQVLKEPEFQKQKTIWNFTRFVEDFENYTRQLSPGFNLQIFIGRENPFSRVKDFSIMIVECFLGKTKRGIVALLGPKRMPYSKNIQLLHALSNL